MEKTLQASWGMGVRQRPGEGVGVVGEGQQDGKVAAL